MQNPALDALEETISDCRDLANELRRTESLAAAFTRALHVALIDADERYPFKPLGEIDGSLPVAIDSVNEALVLNKRYLSLVGKLINSLNANMNGIVTRLEIQRALGINKVEWLPPVLIPQEKPPELPQVPTYPLPIPTATSERPFRPDESIAGIRGPVGAVPLPPPPKFPPVLQAADLETSELRSLLVDLCDVSDSELVHQLRARDVGRTGDLFMRGPYRLVPFGEGRVKYSLIFPPRRTLTKNSPNFRLFFDADPSGERFRVDVLPVFLADSSDYPLNESYVRKGRVSLIA